jgi:hypothetical protein
MSSLLNPPCSPGIELSVPVEYWGPFAPDEEGRVAGEVPDCRDPLRMSLQPVAPQQAKRIAAIDTLFIQASVLKGERPAPETTPARAYLPGRRVGVGVGDAVLQQSNAAGNKR